MNGVDAETPIRKMRGPKRDEKMHRGPGEVKGILKRS
jgi:hypothetical protein